MHENMQKNSHSKTADAKRALSNMFKGKLLKGIVSVS